MDSIKAVILCGGESKRMGQDKSQIEYHDLPQGQYMFDLVKKLGLEVYISCRSVQVHQFEQFPKVIDQYSDIGPISGVISAFEAFENTAIMIIGCDYPLLSRNEIQHWIASRDTSKHATMLSAADNQIEPTLCIYEPRAYSTIHQAYLKGHYSLRKVLLNLHVQIILSLDPTSLLQANTPEEMEIIRHHIQSGTHVKK